VITTANSTGQICKKVLSETNLAGGAIGVGSGGFALDVASVAEADSKLPTDVPIRPTPTLIIQTRIDTDLGAQHLVRV
jgi:hypothetical protein